VALSGQSVDAGMESASRDRGARVGAVKGMVTSPSMTSTVPIKSPVEVVHVT
jgi:hypothetical protein